MHRNRSVDTHRFAMTPRADIPRSSFRIESSHKTTFDSGYLVPVYLEEVLPGDTFNMRATLFARLATPLFPVMDNLHLDSFFFFVPYRLLWANWVKFMGQQDNPDDSTDFSIPQILSAAGGYVSGTLYDYMGLPTAGQVGAGAIYSHSALPLRAYNLIWNEWFRDENLQDSVQVNRASDGPDNANNYVLLRRGKRHDYFTSCLPWPQKGPAVGLAVGTYAPVVSDVNYSGQGLASFNDGGGTSLGSLQHTNGQLSVTHTQGQSQSSSPMYWNATGLAADLSAATAATVNSIRQSFQIQKLLERDARGGTRYAEIVRSHFGVASPDARLQRPEYLGGGSTPIVINPIAQTSGTPATDGTPLGTLGAMATSVAHGHGFSQSFTEHGLVLGLVNVRADLNYQQGMRRMWSRETRYDFYFPAFAHLGEQAVLNKEIYCNGTTVEDDAVFGYQERWAEYRYSPSMITGLFRSTSTGTIDNWHLAQNFTTRPTLNSTFIEEHPPVERVVAVGAAANGQQLIMDCFFRCIAARPLPMYSVPGYLDRF